MQKDDSTQKDANATLATVTLANANSGFAETNTGHGREVAETNTGHGREVAETNTGHGYSSESYAYQDDMNLTGDDLAMNGANVVSGIEVDPIILGTVV